MPEYAPLDIPENPRLAQNIAHFARALRRAGLPIGPGRVVEAVTAVEAAGFTDRTDFYWTLHACFVNRPEHRLVYAQTFRLFWRDPRYLEHMMSLLLPSVRGTQEERPPAPSEKRAAQALLGEALPEIPEEEEVDGEEIEVDASLTVNSEEKLKNLDFEQMSVEEIALAKRALAKMQLAAPPMLSRRYGAAHHGKIDAARTLRRAMRNGGEMHKLHHRAKQRKRPDLVVICDISGSMAQYSRMLLHFLHAASNDKSNGWAAVHGFTFGTRLTNITRHLATRDVDAALAAAGSEAQDWQGGTRIGDCLSEFNQKWSRRVLGQGAITLLVSDGLDRGDSATLARNMERLHLSCKHLIWLNPLLRFDGFAPKANGIRAMLPHVDSFRAGHNLQSFEALAQSLSRPDVPGEKQALMQRMMG